MREMLGANICVEIAFPSNRCGASMMYLLMIAMLPSRRLQHVERTLGTTQTPAKVERTTKPYCTIASSSLLCYYGVNLTVDDSGAANFSPDFR